MKTDSLMNGLLIGFGLGFILATLALYFPIRDFIPQYATRWQFQLVGIFGGIGLVGGIVLEYLQRRRKGSEDEEEKEEDEEENEEEV